MSSVTTFGCPQLQLKGARDKLELKWLEPNWLRGMLHAQAWGKPHTLGSQRGFAFPGWIAVYPLITRPAIELK